MRAILLVAASLLAVSSASAEDAWTRLRNASANELCWDTARGFAREKYPASRRDEHAPTQVSFTRPVPPNPVKESRKSFPGIRTC